MTKLLLCFILILPNLHARKYVNKHQDGVLEIDIGTVRRVISVSIKGLASSFLGEEYQKDPESKENIEKWLSFKADWQANAETMVLLNGQLPAQDPGTENKVETAAAKKLDCELTRKEIVLNKEDQHDEFRKRELLAKEEAEKKLNAEKKGEKLLPKAPAKIVLTHFIDIYLEYSCKNLPNSGNIDFDLSKYAKTLKKSEVDVLLDSGKASKASVTSTKFRIVLEDAKK